MKDMVQYDTHGMTWMTTVGTKYDALRVLRWQGFDLERR